MAYFYRRVWLSGLMSSSESNSLDGGELTLFAPGYSVQEDAASSDLRSRTQQAASSTLLVPTSLLSSSTDDVGQSHSMQTSTSDDLSSVDDISQMRSESSVSTGIHSPTYSELLGETATSESSSPLPAFEKRLTNEDNNVYHFLGSSTDQAAILALKQSSFVVYKDENTSDAKVGFHLKGTKESMAVRSADQKYDLYGKDEIFKKESEPHANASTAISTVEFDRVHLCNSDYLSNSSCYVVRCPNSVSNALQKLLRISSETCYKMRE
ncbi:hypothetical protein KIN20_002285 [Parelaphostrongylus tenuis]|uniref:Uncharacterized protein n=1 Tax=Parelaphostrongylus tenuis TaxID=148309 RepID=A0AAD5MNC5_PARTN|nr:hypothetical protein KIN20_002285 [Parelaphostrongylus tenuis]